LKCTVEDVGEQQRRAVVHVGGKMIDGRVAMTISRGQGIIMT